VNIHALHVSGSTARRCCFCHVICCCFCLHYCSSAWRNDGVTVDQSDCDERNDGVTVDQSDCDERNDGVTVDQSDSDERNDGVTVIRVTVMREMTA